MTHLKVAHITTIDLSLRYLLLNQLRSLQQAGYEVVGISSPGPAVSAIEAAGIRHLAIPMTRRASTPFADLQALWCLVQAMRRERFTIVHTHTPKAGVLGRWAAKLAGVPIVVHTHHGFVFHERSPRLWRALLIALEKSAARCADLIFSVNRADIETPVRAGIGDPQKLMPLGHGGLGVDTSRFDPNRFSPDDIMRKRRELGLPDDAHVVGFVGRLVREKGLLELCEAARIVRTQRPQPVRFLIIGQSDRAKPDALTPAIAREHGIAHLCVFTGLREDLPELYALMDVLVLPSYREGFGLVLAEAAAMGVPVIATNIRGCREAVEHARNGWLVPLGDVQALADAIVTVLTDRDQARRMGEAGRRLALERFDERLVFQKVKAEYARLLKQKGL